MISIIVPVFNAGRYLDKCIASILTQTYSDFELILINDGSTDNSLQLCNKYAQIDSRIIVVSQQNSGAGVARNAGLKIANGDYVGFVDSDDYIHSSMYELLYDAAISNNADIVQCGYVKVSAHEDVISGSNYTNLVQDNPKKAFEDYCKHRNVDNYSPCKLFKRERITDIWFGDYKYSEDAYFIFQAFLKCRKLVVIPDQLYYYVQTPDSACRRPYNLHYEDTIKVGEFMYNLTLRTYPDLAFYFARYTAIWIRFNYLERERQNVSRNVLKSYLILFKKYYSYSKIGYPNNIEKALLMLFRISPCLYKKLKYKRQ